MFGSFTIPPVPTSPPPPAPIRLIVDDPLALTWQRLRDALYCCAPCGESTLAQHLALRGYDATPTSVERAMRELVTTGGVRVASRMGSFGGVQVPLMTLPGQERVA